MPSRAGASRETSGSLQIRPLTISDFGFIRDLASKTDGYTVCPPYILWMLSRFHGKLCAVAEEVGIGPVGYLLSLSGDLHPGSVFVWQLACTFRGQRLKAPLKLAQYLKSTMRECGINTVYFTTIPESRMERDIASLAERVFGTSPVAGPRLPAAAANNEREYKLRIRDGSKRK